MAESLSQEQKLQKRSLKKDETLDHNSPLPLYFQLKKLIRRYIIDRIWEEEQMIPSENELAATLSISPGTVRMAINDLVHEGVLFRKHGKGTFITRPDFRNTYIRFFHSLPNDPNEKEIPSSEVLGCEVGTFQDKIKAILKLKKDDRMIFIRRLRQKRAIPILLEDIYLPEKNFMNFDPNDFSKDPLYPIYANKYRVSVMRADDYFEARNASKEAAAALRIKIGDPVIFIERIAYTYKEKPIEYRACIGRGDLFRYHNTVGRKEDDY